MKYLVLLCDGMADRPFEALGGKTPMQLAKKPNMDKLAAVSELGMCKTVAQGLKPGSDVANLSVMGYDPMECYTGRSPLEAASIGVDMKDTDVMLRTNLVTLSDEQNYCDKTMVDYCAGDISTEEAAEIIKSIDEHFGGGKFKFYPGVSYRHCLVVDNGTTELGNMTPPHDISGRVVGEYLSDSENAAELIDMMKQSYDFLKNHPVNIKRVAEGKRPANSIWLWGEGRKPALENFYEKFGKKCAVVSAVDLIKGIGILSGMELAEVDGATGYIDTNFSGKKDAALKLFENNDLVYVHIEAPDECGHRGEAGNKVKAIELIDELVLGPILEHFEGKDLRVLIMPDHPTPLEIKTHSSDPVPYLLYDSKNTKKGAKTFTEETAAASGVFEEFGPNMMKKLLQI